MCVCGGGGCWGEVLWGCEVGNSPLEMFGMSVVHPTRHMAMFLGHLTEKQGSAACLPPEHMLRPLSGSTARDLSTCRTVEKYNRQCVIAVQHHVPS